MTKIVHYFLFLGTPAIALVSSSLLTMPKMSPLVPMPIYLVLLFWFSSFGFLIFLPALYILSVLVLNMSKNVGRLVVALTSAIFILDMAYFANSWNYGLMYQGQYHTTHVFVENLIGFGVVFCLSFSGLRRSSKTYQQSANLLLFILLAWCAFPYLGELL